MKTYLDVIKETVEFYGTDPKGRRSINPARTSDRPRWSPSTPGCLYVGVDGKRCAFARCTAPVQEARLSKHEGKDAKTTLSGSLDDAGPIVLAPEYAHLTNGEFWNELQSLHDEEDYWDLEKGGLSQLGQRYVDNEVKRWAGAECVHLPDPSVRWCSRWMNDA